MFLGVKTKNRKSPSVQLNYIIHIQEIKPWPPSQSLRSLRSALIQWEHGEKNSGSTKAAAPLLVANSGVGDGRIEFNESFKVPVTLLREIPIKAGDGDNFQKNCIEFNLYEPRRDKTVKGQLLATAIVDLAQYGVVKESLNISTPMNCKRTFSNAAQPVLFLKIQVVERNRARSLSRDSMNREGSVDGIGSESVSALMNEEYAEEAETSSFTDDDVSSHSSIAASSCAFESNGSSTPQRENGAEVVNGISGKAKSQEISVPNKRATESDRKLEPEPNVELKESSCYSSSTDLFSYPENANGTFKLEDHQVDEKGSENSMESLCEEDDDKARMLPKKAVIYRDKNDSPDGKDGRMFQESRKELEIMEDIRYHAEDDTTNIFGQNDAKLKDSLGAGTVPVATEDLGANTLNGDKMKSVKSVRSLMDSGKSNGSVRFTAQNGSQNLSSSERKDMSVHPKQERKFVSDSKVRHLEQRVKILEGELRDAAAIEVSLYSVVAEHGSSINKVHAPAHRLSRLYLHACKENLQSRRGSGARSAVSGLILVAKACGNDVPRLTFWLSNAVVLRAIISEAFEGRQAAHNAGPFSGKNGRMGNNEIIPSLKWRESSSKKESRSALQESSSDWEDPRTFTSALEKVEAWIFSRIIESVWWQTLTPYMQSSAARAIARVVGSGSSKFQRTSTSHYQEQANFSLELWKTAFMDACERICPVRAGGHECGCLPVLSRLVMEQCMARLDVAMFNAILRESAEEVPTDPVSDPISDPNVLPIPSGKASFGAGAQLKNAIGNWSMWLTDLFGIDDDDSFEDENELGGSDESARKDQDTSFKTFHLLNALSDLMMLPKDLLLSSTIRKEVCPTFGAPLIKRILDTFVPDEFCPDPIPKVVLEALDSEDPYQSGEHSVINLPCAASPAVYHPPSASSIGCILGSSKSQTQLMRSGSSVLKKSNTSDDELDELDSPLASIIDGSRASAAPTSPSWTLNGNQNTIRYQLLREVWMNSE